MPAETEPGHRLSPGDESLFEKLSAAFGGQIGVFVFGFISQIILARSLGPAGKGTFSLVVLIVMVVFTVFHGSLSSANAHFTGRHAKSSPGIIGNSLFLALVWGSLVAAVFISIAARLLNLTIPDVDVDLVKMIALGIPALLLMDYFISIVMGQNRIKRFSFTLAMREMLFLTFLIYLAITNGMSVKGALLCWLAALGLVSLFALWSVVSWADYKLRIDLQIFPGMARYSLQSHTANLTTFLRLRFDVLIVAHLLDVTAVGYYTIANGLISLLWYLPASAAQVLVPHISWRDNTVGDSLTPFLCRITFFITAIAGMLMAGLGWFVIKFAFGTDFLPAYPALLLLIPGGVFYSLAKLLAGDLAGRGLPHYAMKISILTLILNVAINLLLIPAFGIAGAAITATLTYGISGMLFLGAFRKESGISLRRTLLLRRDDLRMIYGVLRRKSPLQS